MKYGTLLILMGICGICTAQIGVTASVNVSVSLPNVALLNIEPNNSAILLALQSPTVAGAPVTVPSNNAAKWLNFTSAISAGLTRKIMAQITSGSVPSGLRLKLSLSGYSGTGSGALGSSATGLTLNNSAQNIITSIGGAFTGNGTNNGYNLVYGLEISNYSQLRYINSGTLVITYTLLDN